MCAESMKDNRNEYQKVGVWVASKNNVMEKKLKWYLLVYYGSLRRPP